VDYCPVLEQIFKFTCNNHGWRSALLPWVSERCDAIKRVIINYKKLSKANVTLTKARSRLADLQKYWEKVQSLHARINRATAEDRKKLPYFLQDEFLAAEDAYNEAADYLQEAISSFVKPEGPVCDPSTDSTFCDLAGMLDVVTDNSLNKGSSFVNNVSVQNCDPSTDSTFCDFAGTPDTVTDNARNKSRSFVNNVSVPKCVYCTGLHSLENCEKFLLLSVEQRSTLAREM